MASVFLASHVASDERLAMLRATLTHLLVRQTVRPESIWIGASYEPAVVSGNRLRRFLTAVVRYGERHGVLCFFVLTRRRRLQFGHLTHLAWWRRHVRPDLSSDADFTILCDDDDIYGPRFVERHRDQLAQAVVDVSLPGAVRHAVDDARATFAAVAAQVDVATAQFTSDFSGVAVRNGLLHRFLAQDGAYSGMTDMAFLWWLTQTAGANTIVADGEVTVAYRIWAANEKSWHLHDVSLTVDEDAALAAYVWHAVWAVPGSEREQRPVVAIPPFHVGHELYEGYVCPIDGRLRRRHVDATDDDLVRYWTARVAYSPIVYEDLSRTCGTSNGEGDAFTVTIVPSGGGSKQ
jgi:hypothetical protein